MRRKMQRLSVWNGVVQSAYSPYGRFARYFSSRHFAMPLDNDNDDFDRCCCLFDQSVAHRFHFVTSLALLMYGMRLRSMCKRHSL